VSRLGSEAQMRLLAGQKAILEQGGLSAA